MSTNKRKVVIAPQGFKGNLSAWDVAQSINLGVKRVWADAETVLIPMADGGEGTVDCLVNCTHGSLISAVVMGPLGQKVKANWGILGNDNRAVIEMAAASGITLVPRKKLNPLITTTYGTGELIQAALNRGYRKLIIGIGGSATNDGGAGCAQALGAKFLDEKGEELPQGGASLNQLVNIDITRLDKRLAECDITVLSDVNNPLCGETGASRIYGPQKGANSEMVQQLDKALDHFADVVKKDLGIDVKNIPGAGAAGGLGAGLVAFLKAKIVPGIDVISEVTKLDNHLNEAVLLFTGEGRLDAQTLFGKTIAGIAMKAKLQHVPVVAIAGEISVSGEYLYKIGIDASLSIAPGPISLKQSLDNAKSLITDAAERALRLISITLKK